LNRRIAISNGSLSLNLTEGIVFVFLSPLLYWEKAAILVGMNEIAIQ